MVLFPNKLGCPTLEVLEHRWRSGSDVCWPSRRVRFRNLKSKAPRPGRKPYWMHPHITLASFRWLPVLNSSSTWAEERRIAHV